MWLRTAIRTVRLLFITCGEWDWSFALAEDHVEIATKRMNGVLSSGSDLERHGKVKLFLLHCMYIDFLC